MGRSDGRVGVKRGIDDKIYGLYFNISNLVSGDLWKMEIGNRQIKKKYY